MWTDRCGDVQTKFGICAGVQDTERDVIVERVADE